MVPEVNLKHYFVTLRRRWFWLVIAAIVTASVAGVFTSLIPKKYKATALIVVVEPVNVVQFDERFRTLVETQPLRILPELAESDQVLNLLADDLNVSSTVASDFSIEELRGMLSAEAGNDANLIRLSVQAHTPDNAAKVANAWAKVFVTLTNEIFRDRGGTQLAFFEERVTEASMELEKAENALVEFESINRANILNTSLVTYAQYQTDYLIAKRDASLLVQDVRRLKAQLEQTSVDPGFTQDLTVFILQLRSYNAQNVSPFLIDSNVLDSLINSSNDDQKQQIDFLISSLESQLIFFDTRLEELDVLILDFQKERQEFVNEQVRLTRDFEIAQETYTALERKLEEERITSQDTSSGLSIASLALPPKLSTSPRPIMAAAIAALLGFVITALALLSLEWLQPDNT